MILEYPSTFPSTAPRRFAVIPNSINSLWFYNIAARAVGVNTCIGMTTNCTHCGMGVEINLAGQEVTCPGCGKSFVVPAAPGQLPAPATTTKSTSALAIASLVLSLSTLLGLGPLGCISGIVCGHIARAELRSHPMMEGQGFANAGLAIGYAFLALAILAILILAAVLGWSLSFMRG